MIVPDINLLIYAYNEQAPKHSQAKTWWENCLNGEDIIGIPWIVISGYLRLMTHARVMTTPMPVTEATANVRQWISQPVVRTIEPGSQFAKHFLRNLEVLGTAGNLTTDAFIAAIAQEHQAEVHSNDADFARFQGLRHKNPLTHTS
jgi:toxin-antitoxin system PIN domain toxin